MKQTIWFQQKRKFILFKLEKCISTDAHAYMISWSPPKPLRGGALGYNGH